MACSCCETLCLFGVKLATYYANNTQYSQIQFTNNSVNRLVLLGLELASFESETGMQANQLRFLFLFFISLGKIYIYIYIYIYGM